MDYLLKFAIHYWHNLSSGTGQCDLCFNFQCTQAWQGFGGTWKKSPSTIYKRKKSKCTSPLKWQSLCKNIEYEFMPIGCAWNMPLAKCICWIMDKELILWLTSFILIVCNIYIWYRNVYLFQFICHLGWFELKLQWVL